MTHENKKPRRAPCRWRREEWKPVDIVCQSAMMAGLREGGVVCFNWEWVNLIDSERKKQSITYAVDTAQDLSLSLSSENCDDDRAEKRGEVINI